VIRDSRRSRESAILVVLGSERPRVLGHRIT
jgi:hypothetical protein